ncbi:hypothetical protein [Maridesulfovibrio sp.]|uniref:hypothetical protein n=1 Tax=Maridesulfovibrio sp. TaxID=2795000 RepID=UPI002A18DAAD|nr:hypothetical protein [Maridesulfovibrio sp.]
MIPIGTILSFIGSGKGKLILGLAAGLVLVAGFLIWVSILKFDIARLEGVVSDRNSDISRLESDIAGYKLEVGNRDTEITLLKQSGNQTARVILGLKSQLAESQKTARWYRLKQSEANRLLRSAKNYPVTNATGVISNENSRLAAHFINDALGLCPEPGQ